MMVKRLKQLRIEKGISQQQLAAVLGVSQQSINKYENHRVEPDISTLIAIADYFETSIDYLVGRMDDAAGSASSITRKESAMLADYRAMSSDEQYCMATLIKTFKSLKEK